MRVASHRSEVLGRDVHDAAIERIAAEQRNKRDPNAGAPNLGPRRAAPGVAADTAHQPGGSPLGRVAAQRFEDVSAAGALTAISSPGTFRWRTTTARHCRSNAQLTAVRPVRPRDMLVPKLTTIGRSYRSTLVDVRVANDARSTSQSRSSMSADGRGRLRERQRPTSELS